MVATVYLDNAYFVVNPIEKSWNGQKESGSQSTNVFQQ